MAKSGYQRCWVPKESSDEQTIFVLLEKHNLMTGSIKKLTDKGFGFITAEGLAKDLFFHSKNLVGVMFEELREGDAVSFEMEESDKGPNAVNVQRA